MTRFLLALCFMLVGSVAFAQTQHDLKVLRVIDGDTIVVSAPFLPVELHQHLLLRVYGVDTPEKGARAQCKQENDKSLQAKLFVEQQISNGKQIRVTFKKWDKYGGRVLGDIIIDGVPLSKQLIDSGYARAYFGRKKMGWCKR